MRRNVNKGKNVNFEKRINMVMTIKKGSDKRSIESVLKRLRTRKKKVKGIDAYKYCGVITLKEAPVDIQKRMRSEWD